MKFRAEYTDTFGGEANYSWVRRAEFDLPASASNCAVMRRAKLELGLSGMRGRTFQMGGTGDLEFRPYRSCTVMFVSAEA